MYKGSIKQFFFEKTTHRIPKILTLAISSCVLVAMVNIDASASAFGGRDSLAVRTDVVRTLNSVSSGSLSGLVKRWTTSSVVIVPSTPPTTAPVSGGSGGGGGGGVAPGTTTTSQSGTTTTVTPTPTT